MKRKYFFIIVIIGIIFTFLIYTIAARKNDKTKK